MFGIISGRGLRFWQCLGFRVGLGLRVGQCLGVCSCSRLRAWGCSELRVLFAAGVPRLRASECLGCGFWGLRRF